MKRILEILERAKIENQRLVNERDKKVKDKLKKSEKVRK